MQTEPDAKALLPPKPLPPAGAGGSGKPFRKLNRDGPSALQFEIHGLDLSVVNGLRRTLLTDVEIPAVHFKPQDPINPDVVFMVNTGSLHNEFLGHRLSLVPLCFNAEDVDTFRRDDYKFAIRAQCVGSTPLLVTSGDIKILSADGVLQPRAMHERVFPRNPVTGDHLLITKLKPNFQDPSKGEALHVEFHASMGSARESALWSPVSLSTFHNTVDDAKAAAAMQAHLAKLKEAGAKEEELADAATDFNALHRARHYYADDEGNPTRFQFSLETVCGLSCEQLVSRALRVMKKKTDTLRATLDEGMRVDTSPQQMHIVYLDNCNHTHGSIIQSYMYRHGAKFKVGFVGYHMPHPLEERVVFKVQSERTDIKDMFASVMSDIAAELYALNETWVEATKG